ncbi:MAG: DUF1295 domain-containing protein [Pyrobaculum sp.]
MALWKIYKDIVDFWIYRYSRHPQYLGYIVWSYGVLIYICYKPYIKGAFSTPPSLIWLATTLILISTALLEERQMVKKYGDRYVQYCKKPPSYSPTFYHTPSGRSGDSYAIRPNRRVVYTTANIILLVLFLI